MMSASLSVRIDTIGIILLQCIAIGGIGWMQQMSAVVSNQIKCIHWTIVLKLFEIGKTIEKQ